MCFDISIICLIYSCSISFIFSRFFYPTMRQRTPLLLFFVYDFSGQRPLLQSCFFTLTLNIAQKKIE